MSTPGQVRVANAEGCEILRLTGDVDHANAAMVERDAIVLVRATAGVIIDLTGTTFLDSAGLRCLDHLVTAFANRGAPVRVVAPTTGMIRFTLDLVGFSPELLTETLDRALSDMAC